MLIVNSNLIYFLHLRWRTGQLGCSVSDLAKIILFCCRIHSKSSCVYNCVNTKGLIAPMSRNRLRCYVRLLSKSLSYAVSCV